MIARTEAAGRIIDVMTGGNFDWRSRLDESDFLNSGDWMTALAYADAALATPRTDAGERWKTIDSAPKDGTRIIVINDRGQFMVEFDAEWSPDGWWLCVDGKHDDRPLRGSKPTHWMPLPAAPSRAGDTA